MRKCPEVRALIDLQRNTGSNLRADRGEFLAVLNIGVIGVADHHAGCLEPFGRNTLEAATFQQSPRPAAKLPSAPPSIVETIGFRFR